MKHIIALVIVTLALHLVSAQQIPEVDILASVDEVTIFLKGAEMKFQQKVNLTKGETKCVIKGISPYIKKESLQLSVSDNIEVVAVSFREVSYDLKNIDQTTEETLKKIRQVEDLIRLIQNQIEAFETEKQMLIANQQITARQTTVSLTDLGKAGDFFRERFLLINNNLSQRNKESERLCKTLDSLKSVQEEHTSKLVTSKEEIVLILSSSVDQSAEISVRYIVDNASWEPAYEIISTDITNPVMVKYKARIYNYAGIDWKNVIVNLSTSDPSLGANRPFLTAWTLNYTTLGNEGILQNRPSNNLFVDDSVSRLSDEDVFVDELGYTFRIQEKYSIMNGKEPSMIEILKQSLNAKYEYLVIPKVEASAFLLAKVAGWEKLNFIDGPASIYFGNTYIGETLIDTRGVSDTLEISFGRDNKILVGRSKLEDVGGTKLIGTKRTESFLYEINVKNNRKSQIEIRIHDQIPVSQETDIIVEPSELSGASLDKLSGRLQWFKTIQPEQGVKLRIGFSVKYPKNKTVVVRKQRMIKTARYRR